jgi:hypothetical protein
MHAAILLFAAVAATTFGPGGRFHLEHNQDGFGLRSHGVIEDLGGGRTKFYPLPQSTRDDYGRLRPEDYKLPPDSYDRVEVIGPHQVEGDKLWFGNSYYDSEGSRGVGAFGYFDCLTRAYTLFRPHEVARWEISAILVQPEKVWLGLDHFGEDISTSPGGLASWDRMTHEIRHYPLEFSIKSICMEGESLRLEAHYYGYALFHEGQIRRFLANGKPVPKFPPPPSHY